MILRRLTKHVKDQNWFAVALDFVMVVVGILIAFQISNWGNARGDRRVYDEASERAMVELNRNLAMQDSLRKSIAIELPIIQRALEDLRTCRADDEALANVKAAMVPLNSPYVMRLDTASLEQFLRNDAFLKYQPPEARERLGVFLRSARHFLEFDRMRFSQKNQSMASMPDAISLGPLTVSGPDEILNFILSGSPLSVPLHREPIIVVPLEEACKDKAFVAAFFDWEADAFQISITAGLLQPQLRGVLEAFGRPVADEEEAREAQ